MLAEPNFFTFCFKKEIFSTIAEFITILSAPALNIAREFFKVLIPPATDKGTNIFLAVFLINFDKLLVP